MKYNFSPSISTKINQKEHKGNEKFIILFNRKLNLPLIKNSQSKSKLLKNKSNKQLEMLSNLPKEKLRITKIMVLISNTFNKTKYNISDKYEKIKINSKTLFYKNHLTEPYDKSKEKDSNNQINVLNDTSFKIHPYLYSGKSYPKLYIPKQYKAKSRKITNTHDHCNLKKTNSTKIMAYQREKLNQMRNELKSTNANREIILNQIACLVGNTNSQLINMKSDLNLISNHYNS